MSDPEDSLLGTEVDQLDGDDALRLARAVGQQQARLEAVRLAAIERPRRRVDLDSTYGKLSYQ